MPPKKRDPADLLPANEIKRLKSALKSKKGNPGIDELAKKYAEGDKSTKRNILNRYIEDRSLSWRFEICQKTELLKVEKDSLTRQWRTKKQVAADEGMTLDDPDLPDILEGLEVRDHEIPALAAKGVKQYRVSHKSEIQEDTQTEGVVFTNTTSGFQKVKHEQTQGAKTSLTAAGTPSLPSGAGGIQVNWINVTKAVMKNCRTALREAMALQTLAAKHRMSVASEDRNALRDGLKLLQEAIESCEDIMAATSPCEVDRDRLQLAINNMKATTACFKDLLYHVAPRSKPAEKATET